MISKQRCNIQDATEEKIKGAGGGRMSLASKEKNGLIKHNMSRYNNPTHGEVETTISLMIRRISQKDTCCRTRRELVWRSGLQIRITQATEDAQVIISGIGV